jgi:peptidyl-tRNA hydrolase
MGVGKPPENIPLIDFVLMNERGTDKERLAKARQRAAEALVAFIRDADFDKLMRELNKEIV